MRGRLGMADRRHRSNNDSSDDPKLDHDGV
jgi:hypothetical protein